MSNLISKIVVPDSSEATGYALYNVKDANAIRSSEKGVASGVATLDSSGKVPSSQLPSYVDDVIEGYYHDNKFYSTYTEPVEGDDAAQAAWGEGWRMPTQAEFLTLISSVTYRKVTNYQGSGVTGLECVDKNDNSKILFFPATGFAREGRILNLNDSSYCWSTTLKHENNIAGAGPLLIIFSSSSAYILANSHLARDYGLPIRPVLASGDSTRPYVEIGGIKWATMNIGAESVTDTGLYFLWGDIQGYTASQVGSGEGLKYFGWADYKYGDGTSNPGVAGMTKYNSTDGLTTLTLATPESYSDEITAETGKIYVDIQTNQSYRWSGSTYIVISSPYVLPTASANTLGGVKVGDGLAIDNNGVLSALEYESKQASEGGADVSLVTTGEKYIWNNKSSAVTTSTLPVSNGVYAIYADGSLKTAAEADSDALGVAVITDDCCFVIDKTNDTLAAWDSQYQTNTLISGCTAVNTSNDAVLDFAGIANTDAIVSVTSGVEAAKYCRTKSIAINGVTKYGYLGACGEWKTAYNNKTTINSILSTIGGTAIYDKYYGASTLRYDFFDLVWTLDWQFGNTSSREKNLTNFYVRPFYPITKQELEKIITTNIPTVTIEQSTGSSTTNVMSLKTVSDHITDTDIHVTAAEKEYWNSKINPPSYSAPTAKTLTYTGSAQDLLNAGSATAGGTIQYSTDETNWSTTIPQGTNADTYTVYWRFIGTEVVYVDSTAINVSIAKVTPTVTAPTAKVLTYDATAQELVNAGSTDFGTLQYSLDNLTYGTSIPSGTNAGDYTVYYKVMGDSNANDVAAQNVSCNIGKANRTVTISGNQTSMSSGLSNTITITATGNPSSSLISITSSNTSVATVSGLTISAVGSGTTTITVTVASDANYNSGSTSYSLNVAYPNGIYAAYADGSMRTAENADTNAIGVAVITDNCKFIIDKTNNTNAAWDSKYSTNGIISGCFVTNDRNTAITNYTGVSNTDAIAAVASGGEAAKYCRSCSKTIAGKTVYGYLGACGEWYVTLLNKTTVNSIMSAIGGTVINSGYFWTSTLGLSNSANAWLLDWGSGDRGLDSKGQTYGLFRPFYEIS